MAKTQHQTAYRTVKAPLPGARQAAGAEQDSNRSYPYLRKKKPASGNPVAGAHFVSFNFLNSAILIPESRGRKTGIVLAGAIINNRVSSRRCVAAVLVNYKKKASRRGCGWRGSATPPNPAGPDCGGGTGVAISA